MSPEQCRAEAADDRSDLYSLGATYYSLLAGRPPYSLDIPLQVMFAQCSSPYPNRTRSTRGIPTSASASFCGPCQRTCRAATSRPGRTVDRLGGRAGGVVAGGPSGIGLRPGMERTGEGMESSQQRQGLATVSQIGTVAKPAKASLTARSSPKAGRRSRRFRGCRRRPALAASRQLFSADLRVRQRDRRSRRHPRPPTIRFVESQTGYDRQAHGRDRIRSSRRTRTKRKPHPKTIW